ncbi:mercuric reductase [Geobacter argillaceus]|uniref:Pyruvate/2-oxoglutarate dehydrogenase complex dihydrolipoamide dehydrogenase (E3) component n=1 Tax=Geobacter argillaceus TaxID=345631 RepID=A0A562V6R2_9BACT|nr:mercuric reductase [Geobacter argillaceus]TWJ13417.1 pyruvate/2-oxoglutarate dehydrogenase complex dihydrolipoamide dehydrogenase (E3) component [Geobacter argillaceus]
MSKGPLILPENDYNQSLVNDVHPSGWINPEPADCYNLVVIGAGTAGLVTAAGAAGLGAKVALIERHLLGGDCLNYGCVPSKGIIRAARAIFDVRTAREFGIMGGEQLSIDFADVMKRMRRIRSEISPHDSARRFRDELGVDLFFGTGRFTGPDAIEVEGKRLRFKRAALCSGARAAAPPIPGIEEAGYLTNETVFSLTSLPPRLAVIGGGPIGCELAQTFARLGSKVTVIEYVGHLLSREDADAAEVVQQAMIRDGVELCLQARIVGVTRNGSERIIRVEQDGSSLELVVDEILVGIGRAPNVEGLDLEAAGVAYDPKQGVKVDERLRTSNPRVFAAGDICFPYKFTHTADALARILIANALFMGRQKSSALVVPWCTYTDPEVAHVGMYEKDAAGRGIEVTTLTVPLADVDRALLDGEAEGFARVHLKKGTDRILGATIVARHAGEMINELSLAMTAGVGLSAIGRTIHPYPTQAEAIKKLADAYNRTRLTPFVKKVLGAWLGWQRS